MLERRRREGFSALRQNTWGAERLEYFIKGIVIKGIVVFELMAMSLPGTAAMEDPLHDAINAGNLEKVKTLFSDGADVDPKDSYDKSPWTLPEKTAPTAWLGYLKTKWRPLPDGLPTPCPFTNQN